MHSSTKFVNLCDHPITVEHPGASPGDFLQEMHISPCGLHCRVDTIITGPGIDGHSFYEDIVITNLPPAKEGVIYITSYVAAKAAWAIGRKDVVCPVTQNHPRVKKGPNGFVLRSPGFLTYNNRIRQRSLVDLKENEVSHVEIRSSSD